MKKQNINNERREAAIKEKSSGPEKNLDDKKSEISLQKSQIPIK
jgi:hypothetical protein